MLDSIYSPVEEVFWRPITQKGHRLFVKREDLSHPFISGNKWRKLKYHLRDAKEKGFERLITYGGAYSNHLLAVACAGAKYKFKTFGIVRGEEVSNHMLSMCTLFGMKLFFVTRDDYKNNKELLAKKLANNAYVINEGGDSALGEQGVAEVIKDIGESTSHLFCSVGTGGTLAGLYKGILAEKRSNLTLHGIMVVKGDGDIQQRFNSNEVKLYDRFHFGGYAKVTPLLKEFVKAFASETGILLDYVYEAKMMYAIAQLCEENALGSNQNIMALHNGGLLGMLSMLD